MYICRSRGYYLFSLSNSTALRLVLQRYTCIVRTCNLVYFLLFFYFLSSKMINFSVPDTIDERTINKKKLTPFTIQVLKHNKIVYFSPQDAFM